MEGPVAGAGAKVEGWVMHRSVLGDVQLKCSEKHRLGSVGEGGAAEQSRVCYSCKRVRSFLRCFGGSQLLLAAVIIPSSPF